MATGSPGTNGVWQYGEDDSEATFSALLNKAASTTDTAIGLDRGRLTNLEATAPGTAGQPFKQAAGVATNSNSAVGVNSGWYITTTVTVTFPSGRFNVAPIVHANVIFGGVTATAIQSVSSTNFVFQVARLSDYAGGQAVGWSAVQMTSTTGNG
jgi:hypothetical protein